MMTITVTIQLYAGTSTCTLG